MRMANTVKLNGVRPEVIKLQLFPFSLREKAATWFDSLPVGSVNTWEELVEDDSCHNRVSDQQNLYLNYSYYRSVTTAV